MGQTTRKQTTIPDTGDQLATTKAAMAALDADRQAIRDGAIDLTDEVRKLERQKREIYQLLIAGLKVDEIADRYGLEVPQVEAIADEMADRTMKSMNNSKGLAALDLDRLEALLRVLWANAMGGDVYSIDRCVKILERRSKMLGLDTPAALKLAETEGDLSHMTISELTDLKKLQEKALRKKP